MNDLLYPVTLLEDKEVGGYTVTFPDVPEAITEGDTLDEALVQAVDVLSLCLAVRMEDGKEIPLPGKKSKHMVAPEIRVQLAILVHKYKGDRTTAEMARSMGTSWSAVQQIERPNKAPTVKSIEKVAATLGLQAVLRFEKVYQGKISK